MIQTLKSWLGKFNSKGKLTPKFEIEYIPIELECEVRDLNRPKEFDLVIVNDDITPLEFVLELLQKSLFFDKDRALRVAVEIHSSGKCHVFSHSLETIEQLKDFIDGQSNKYGYPLQCFVEESI